MDAARLPARPRRAHVASIAAWMAAFVALALGPLALALPAHAEPSPTDEATPREAPEAGDATATDSVDPGLAADAQEDAAADESTATGRRRRPRHGGDYGIRWSDGPRRVPTPRGVSMQRASELGLGTRDCASQLLHGAPDARWTSAARGRAPERLLWPVDDGGWVRGFGYVRTTRPDLIHRGVDIGAPVGTTVRAAADGIVAYSDNGIHGYGNVVMIVHRNGWMTLYAHNARTTVQPGYRVRRGERIAIVGTTGITHGPHVHFELWRDGHAVDPSTLFDGGPTYVERLGERAARRGDVPPPREVTAADRPDEAPLAPHPEDTRAAVVARADRTTSQRSTATSPRSTAASSRSTATSPRSTATSQRSTATSPRSTAASSRSTATSPRSTATGQQSTATSPRSTATSPRSAARAPRTPARATVASRAGGRRR